MEKDPYEYFRVEAREILEALGRGVLQIEKGAAPDVAAGLLRLAHTLKGAARVVKQRTIAEQAHAIEEALSPLREPHAAVARERIDQVLSLVDAIAAQVATLDPPAPARAATGTPAGAPFDDTFRTVRADVAEMDALLEGVAEASVQLRSLRRTVGAVERASRLATLLVTQLAPGRASEGSRAEAATVSPKLRSLAGELRGVVSSVQRGLTGAVEQTDRELQEVRAAAERLRLLPTAGLFTSLERATRDAAQFLGKEAAFSARGGDVRLEAHVLGVVQAALIQAVRNAVAHGIEPGAERLRAGKAPVGRVDLEVARRGNRIEFHCRDDGRGIDLAAVRRAAERRGLLPHGQEPPKGDLLSLLLKGGLTTADAVTVASGRGIGLDVVREAVARLGGDVTVETEAGRGTRLSLVVPLSLSSLDVLLVEAGGVAAAIPLEAVRRTVRLGRRDIARTAEGDSIVYAGNVVPLIPLGPWLGGPRAALPDGALSAVVIEGATALAALAVDRLRGIANVVVRSLPALAPRDPLVAGIALDADGTPQLVLDPRGLVAKAVRAEDSVAAPEPVARAAVLVIDDSLTTRMMEQSILESAGYAVDLAVSAEEGLEKARSRRYQLFLVDVEMPGMDGFSFVQLTRADPVLREVPAILVSSLSSLEDRKRGDQAGASAYMAKGDFDQKQLLATIRKLVGR